jgi:hypothetical protein
MKRIFVCLTLLGMLCISASAQNPTDENFLPSLRLRDEVNSTRIFLLKSDGTYFTNACPIYRVESFGQLTRKGCVVSLNETTPAYRVAMVGDACKGTGKLVLQVFGIGTFTVIDRTVD